MKARGSIPTCSNPSIQRRPSPHGHQSWGSMAGWNHHLPNQDLRNVYIYIYINIYAIKCQHMIIFTHLFIYIYIFIYTYGLHDEIIFFLCWIVQNNMPWISILWNPGPGTCLLGRHILHPPTSRAPCRIETPVLLGVARAPLEPKKYALAIAQILIYIYFLHIYIYICVCVYTPYIIGLDPYDWWLTCLVRKPIQWSSRAKVLVNGPSDGVM